MSWWPVDKVVVRVVTVSMVEEIHGNGSGRCGVGRGISGVRTVTVRAPLIVRVHDPMPTCCSCAIPKSDDVPLR